MADEAAALEAAGRGARRPHPRAAHPAGPDRREGRHPRGQGRARAATRRPCSPATWCACTLRYAERQGWKTEVVSATEGELGGYKDVQWRSRAATPANPVFGPAEVRGRRAPRAAGAGHRVAGPHPHPRRRRAGAARGRGGRRHDRPERPAHRRLPLQRARRPERQHHRLRGAHHPPAHRRHREHAEREEPAAEQGGRHARAAGPAAGAGAGGAGRQGQRRARRADPHRWTAPRRCGPTTSRTTASRTTAADTRPTT